LERGPAGSLFAARRVGSSGRVYAVEINRDYLKYISARAEQLSNVRTVLGKEDDPFTPQQSVDAVLILNLSRNYPASPVKAPSAVDALGCAARHH